MYVNYYVVLPSPDSGQARVGEQLFLLLFTIIYVFIIYITRVIDLHVHAYENVLCMHVLYLTNHTLTCWLEFN